MKSIKKYSCENGDLVIATFKAVNTGNDTCHNTKAVLSIPSGVQLNYRNQDTSQGDATPSYNKGTFNPTTQEWMIGDIKSKEVFEIDMEFEITDDSLNDVTPFVVTFTVESNCTEDESDNLSWLIIEKKCPEVVDPEACDNIEFAVK